MWTLGMRPILIPTLSPLFLDDADRGAAGRADRGESEQRPERRLPAAEPRRDPGDREGTEELADVRELQDDAVTGGDVLRRARMDLSLIHISEPTRQAEIS